MNAKTIMTGVGLLIAMLSCDAVMAQQDSKGKPQSSTGSTSSWLKLIKGRYFNIEKLGDSAKTGMKSISFFRKDEEKLNSLLRRDIGTAAAIYRGGGDVGAGGGKGIYHDDDRKNPDDSGVGPNQRRAADATAALVAANKFIAVESSDGKYFDLPSVNDISQGIGLCRPDQAEQLGQPEERFHDEPNPAFCTAFKVGPDLVATAGHCIQTQAACEQARLIFGFQRTKANRSPEKRIPKDKVYSCKRVVDGEFQGADKSDWRVLQVDRVIDAPQVTIRSSAMATVKPGESLTVVGHPMGLPVKLAGGAKVRWLDKAFFVANLDTYGGNSGSPVFNTMKLNAGELMVEGILVRGENDFEVKTPCFISKRCPLDGCRGEDVTFASRMERALNQGAATNVSRNSQ